MRAVSFFELRSTDVERAADFYSRLFGWTILSGEFRAIIGAGLHGILSPTSSSVSGGGTVYVEVPNIDSIIVEATNLGGHLEAGPISTPRGRIARLLDPTGTPFGVYEDATIRIVTGGI